MTKIVVVKTDGQFVLRTNLGHPLGMRLLSGDPPAGKKLPPMDPVYKAEIAAMKASLLLNLYLRSQTNRKSSRNSKSSRSD
jgi:hypothetical protein